MKKSGLAFFAMIFLLISNYSFGQGVDIDTSIMLHIKPELVHLKKLDSAVNVLGEINSSWHGDSKSVY